MTAPTEAWAGEHRDGDPLGERLEQGDVRVPRRRSRASSKTAAVVDRPGEVVAPAGRPRGRARGRRRPRTAAAAAASGRQDAVAALEAHRPQLDPVGHRRLSPGLAARRAGAAAHRPRPSRRAASRARPRRPSRAARTFGRTSWTRTMSTPAATARTVVASVASTRSSGGRSRTLPERRLARRAEQDRAGRGRAARRGREEGQVVLGRLAEAEAGIDDQVLARARRPRRRDRSPARGRRSTSARSAV